MRIEIVEPEAAPRDGKLIKSDTRVLIWCDCCNADRCPQGKIGSQPRCRIWIERKHLSGKGKQSARKMNTFDR